MRPALSPVNQRPQSGMPRTETFKFDLKDKVIIREIQRPGIVESMSIDFLGVRYLVTFWDNSERQTCWLFPDDLESR